MMLSGQQNERNYQHCQQYNADHKGYVITPLLSFIYFEHNLGFLSSILTEKTEPVTGPRKNNFLPCFFITQWKQYPRYKNPCISQAV